MEAKRAVGQTGGRAHLDGNALPAVGKQPEALEQRL